MDRGNSFPNGHHQFINDFPARDIRLRQWYDAVRGVTIDFYTGWCRSQVGHIAACQYKTEMIMTDAPEAGIGKTEGGAISAPVFEYRFSNRVVNLV